MEDHRLIRMVLTGALMLLAGLLIPAGCFAYYRLVRISILDVWRRRRAR